MADESILKSFLVKIGFKHDEGALNNITSGVARATKTVVEFAAVVEAAADVVFYGVVRMADSLEDLYFASVRTGTAAAHLQALDRAAQSFGARSGEALQSAEGLARFLRNNPGGGAFLNGLLGQVGQKIELNADGTAKDLGEAEIALGKLFHSNTERHMQFMNQQIADMIGMNEKTMLAIQDPGYERKVHSQESINERAKLDKAAADAHKFNEALRDVENSLYALGVQVVDVLETKFSGSLHKLNQFITGGPGQSIATGLATLIGTGIDALNHFLDDLNKNPQAYADKIKWVFDTVTDVFHKFITAVNWIVDKMKWLDEKTEGWSTKLMLLAAAAKALGITSMIVGLFQVGAAIATIGTALAGLGGGAAVGGVAAVGGLGAALATLLPVLAAVGLIGWGGYEAWQNGLGDKVKDWGAAAERWVQDINPIRRSANQLMDRGYTAAQAAGISANVMSESSGDSNAVGPDKKHFGLFQLGPGEQANYLRLMGHSLFVGGFGSTPEHPNLDTAENQIDFFTKRAKEIPGLWDAIQSHKESTPYNAAYIAEIMNDRFEKPGGYAVEDPKRAARGAAILQKIDVNMKVDVHTPNSEAGKNVYDRIQKEQQRTLRSVAGSPNG